MGVIVSEIAIDKRDQKRGKKLQVLRKVKRWIDGLCVWTRHSPLEIVDVGGPEIAGVGTVAIGSGKHTSRLGMSAFRAGPFARAYLYLHLPLFSSTDSTAYTPSQPSSPDSGPLSARRRPQRRPRQHKSRPQRPLASSITSSTLRSISIVSILVLPRFPDYSRHGTGFSIPPPAPAPTTSAPPPVSFPFAPI
ncbi:hypothetical protein PNOK_0083400 [Pyrrhoderma noxium]|uniref:Uncharacterized protein n=1 Tax=Pyrrhoderma noxium TaxID=2282107 RepID=A0A286UVY9_9AGAM|nr:hypothetical protein PNOK_0083400 [Pyrrhoderma noxium]